MNQLAAVDLPPAPQFRKYGPYALAPGENNDWFLLVMDDMDDDEADNLNAWGQLLDAHPEFAKTHQLSHKSIHIGQRLFSVQRWGHDDV